MSKGGKKAYLTRALDTHIKSINETFQMLDKSASSSLDKVDWSEVTKLGDEISKQATIVLEVFPYRWRTCSNRRFHSPCTSTGGMLWSGDTPDVKQLEENLGAYCNKLHGFILRCHESTAGAGRTLHASIRASAKQVIDCSLSLLTKAVSACDSCNSKERSLIPQLSGSVWEACVALKKTPTTNCTAIGRAITQVAVSIKDVLREMGELKPTAQTVPSDGDPDGATNVADEPHDDDDSSEGDLSDNLTPEEMEIAQLVISVVSNTLLVIKELIRFITGLLKNSERNTVGYTDSLEGLLSYCQEMGVQVNELGACVYPPQEISQMKSVVKKMYLIVDEIQMQVASFEGSMEGLFRAFEGLKNSLGKLESGLSDDLIPEMNRIAV